MVFLPQNLIQIAFGKPVFWLGYNANHNEEESILKSQMPGNDSVQIF